MRVRNFEWAIIRKRRENFYLLSSLTYQLIHKMDWGRQTTGVRIFRSPGGISNFETESGGEGFTRVRPNGLRLVLDPPPGPPGKPVMQSEDAVGIL